MLKQKIFNWFILVSVMTTGLSSQLLSKEKPRNLFWGLIKIDNEDKDEDIHWFDKWFRTREFATPITYMPVEIRYGLGFNGKFSGSSLSPSAGDIDNWIWYDTDVSPLNQEPVNIVGSSLDIDIGLINIIRHHIRL